MSFSRSPNRGGRSCRLASFLLLATALAAGAPVAVAEDGPIDYTEFSLTELMEMDVVYGASKYEQKAQDAPSAVTVVTASDIQAFGYRTLGEILDGLRGFYTTYDRNYVYLGARGFGRPGDYNSRVLVLIDGVRTNENIYDAAGMGTLFMLDVDLIERIEVIRGPSSSIYGTSAVFGIINIVTREGHQVDGVQARAEVASFGGRKGRLTAGSGAAPGPEWLVSGTIGRSDGQDLYYPEFDDPELGDGWFRDGDRDEWQRIFAKGAWGGWGAASAFSWRDKAIPTGAWETVFGDTRTATTDNQGYVSAWYEGRVASGTDLLARLTYNTYTYRGDWIYDYSEDDEPWLVTFKDDGLGTWWNAETQLTRAFAGGHTVAAGWEQRWNVRQDQSAWDEDPYWLYLKDEHDTSSWGAYVQGEYRFGEGLLVSGGIRHDDYPTFGGTTNPRLSVVARPLDGSVVKLLYGAAFRAPNLYELYYQDHGITSKANPDLQPETIDTYEAVWDQEITPQLHGLVSVYHYEIADLIDQVVDPEDELLVFRNNAAIEADGIELELNGRHGRGLRYRISYSHQEATFTGGPDRLTNSPQDLVKAQLAAPLPLPETSAGIEVLHQTGRLTNAGRETSGFTLAHLNLVLEIPAAGLIVSAGVRNLFDEEYAHPAGVEHWQDVLVQDGRTYRLAVTFNR